MKNYRSMNADQMSAQMREMAELAPTPDLQECYQRAAALLGGAQGAVTADRAAGLTDEQIEDLRSHVRGAQEGKDTYEYELGSGWRCFHCGEMFRTWGGASLHFGKPADKRPSCSPRQSPEGAPVAWRVKNDFGHWHITQDKALADTWRDVEKYDVQPLYLEHFAHSAAEALTIAEDVLSRAPMSTQIWPNGMHPQIGIEKIRRALSSVTEGQSRGGGA